MFVARGCVDAEKLTDEVMNRVAVRIDKLVETYEGDPAKCFHGFAEKVYLEYLRGPREESLPEPFAPETPLSDEREQERQQAREQEDECLTRCLADLSAGDSSLFRRYFQEEKRAKINARKKMAAELRLTANALRIKAHRMRRGLRQCMFACLRQVRAS